MIFILEAYLVGLQTEAPAYAQVTQKLLPQEVFEFVGFKTDAPAYTWISPKTLPQAVVDVVGFNTDAPAYAILQDASPPERVTSEPDPDSTPYVEESQLDPAPDAVGVDLETTVILPCGDRVPEEDEVSFNALSGGGSVVPPRGLAPLKTIIEVSYDTGAYFKIFENGVALEGWSVTSAVNDYSGYERDVNVGITYSIEGPGGILPPDTLIGIRVEIEDYGKKYTVYEYSFHTKPAYYPTVEEIRDDSHLTEWDFPLRFSSNCDLVRTTQDFGIRNNLRNCAMVHYRGIPLRTALGSQMSLEVFDPADVAERQILSVEVVRSCNSGEPRAIVADCLVTETENTVRVIAPYKVLQTGRWTDLVLDVPQIRTVE